MSETTAERACRLRFVLANKQDARMASELILETGLKAGVEEMQHGTPPPRWLDAVA